MDESDFYEIDSRDEQLAFLLRYAILAPSIHNRQPWSFRITADGIEVYADYARRLPVVDPVDRELHMSVGAAIANLRVAAAHFGFETSVLYQPRPEESLPVALISFRETCAPDERLASLFDSIRRRHTNRAVFSGAPLRPDARQALFDLMSEFPRFLRLIMPGDKKHAAELIAAGERAQMARPALRDELSDCMQSSSRIAPWVVRHFDVGQLMAHHDASLVDSSSLLLVIAAEDDRPSLVHAGEVLERVLLTLTRFGLQYSFMNQPIAVDALRSRLWSLVGSSAPPQLLLRIGEGRPVRRATPRRPVQSVLAR
jgi:nitroreductase